ncbi:MAG: ATP-binding protein, partial [Acidobacteriota bacterium]|nr:ATP-binding protein [Acidobacteriota bacterium]
ARMRAAATPLPQSGPAILSDRPPVPDTLEKTGLSARALTELLLKALYVQGDRLGRELMELIRLPFQFVDDRLMELQSRRFVEVRGTSGPNRAAYHFGLTNAGRDRAREALEISHYLGPAPVPLEQYRLWTSRQSMVHTQVSREVVRAAFRGMVLPEAMFEVLGPAINSARSLFLYGAPGNGKTVVAEGIGRALGGEMYVPFAIDVDGQQITAFDPVNHQPIVTEAAQQSVIAAAAHDRRWEKIRRPVVVVGGELTLEMLDLTFNPISRFYEAPIQMKANGGVFVVDDFGRQRIPPRDLLNRWIVPLESRVDYLTLHTGRKFEVPFNVFIVFATNLKPESLADEAFLRRIPYKILSQNPTIDEYCRIFELNCRRKGLPFDAVMVEYLDRTYYKPRNLQMRACHPRDLLDQVVDICRYQNREPVITRELLDAACGSYFIEETESQGAGA